MKGSFDGGTIRRVEEQVTKADVNAVEGQQVTIHFYAFFKLCQSSMKLVDSKANHNVLT